MPPARAPPKRRPFHQAVGPQIGKLGRELSSLGRAAGIAAGFRGPRGERIPEERFREAIVREDRVDFNNPEHVSEYLEIGLRRNNPEMVKKGLLAVIRLGPERARTFFAQFFQERDEQAMDVGRRLYYDYLRFGGKKLGGNFARLDAHFEGLH